jgi:hypothetical protein
MIEEYSTAAMAEPESIVNSEKGVSHPLNPA